MSPCCNPKKRNASPSPVASPDDPEKIRQAVRAGYRAIAVGQQSSCSDAASTSGGGGCCSAAKAPLSADFLAQQIGYSPAEIRALPDGANLGLSCGNPTAIANLRPGQVVLDLGSGGGFDVFLAGPKVGPAGRVIGVDMTPEMIAKARANLASYRRSTGLDNVEFRLGEIEHLPLADASVDVVISNCVINLSPDKPQVWREIARVLRPGGTVAVSDMALLRPLPPQIKTMVQAMVGCVAGAIPVDQYERTARAAGLADVRLVLKPQYVAALARSHDPLYQRIAKLLPPGATPADFITSLDVTARKPV